MQQTQKAGSLIKHSHRQWQCRLLRLAVLIGFVMVVSPSARAADNWEVEGASGVLLVHGVLTESACRLDMASARQDVWLGEIGTGQLQRAGDRGEPVTVRLTLHDCLRSASQPGVSVSFLALADADNPQLIAVRGVSGLALRLTDEVQHDIRLGRRGMPMLLTPGQNELIYSVTPERTTAPLQAGAYRAQLDFQLNYD